MMRIGVAMVFLTDPDKADDIITKIQQQFDIQLLYATTSYSKLWIKKESGGENGED
ncbi:MAG: hypothetical protein JW771_01205 [Candidatus Thermoplasmatota archaeon]|nr:hypothetical protein [Candidatus Thermoplasmatota archaeon]